MQRIVTRQQLIEGYAEFHGGFVTDCRYEVLGRTKDGNYVVAEPKVRHWFVDGVCQVCRQPKQTPLLALEQVNTEFDIAAALEAEGQGGYAS